MNDKKSQINSLHEYITGMKGSYEIFQWLWKEATTTESRKNILMMIMWLSIAIGLQVVAQVAVSYVFKGLIIQNSIMIVLALGAFLITSLAVKCHDMWQETEREHASATNLRCLSDKITSLYLGKSLAQHAHESRRLSASSIDRGKWKMYDMQTQLLFQGIPLAIQILLSFVALCIVDWRSGLGMLFLIAVCLVWSLILNYSAAKECAPIEDDFKSLERRRSERMEHNSRVKTCGHEGQETDEMSEILKEVLVRDTRFWVWFIRSNSLRAGFNTCVLSLVMAWGAWLVWSGEWNIGLLYPLFTWATRISDNMLRLGDFERHINKNVASVKLALDALAIPPAIVDKPDAATLDSSTPHRIEFRNVSHKYPISVSEGKGDIEIPHTLVGIDLVIEKGEKVAIMGPSGSGKTTMMKILLRFDDPTSGSVIVGGSDLRDISLSSYMRGVGYAAQQAEAFDGTIRENLLYGLTAAERSIVTDEQLMRVTRLLKVDFKSLDTVVGTRGLKLSGGQAQRLLLAAAVIKNPWLLVIDEGTASLDSETEREVQDGLTAALSGNTSALIITHRLNTVRNLCTKFLVLRPAHELSSGEPQVEAIAGSFEELYKISPTFRRLADAQGVVCS